ncbi:MAG: type II toxin-antitoxin system prevent-host-death family antitoxin [Hyphomicrobiales bacterium]|nr:type II toxin-antitoxin system prevent-host-death family antitoxin [Hyphomicrobiales bacterium]MBV9138316.1 type II toxin-antitoxin system prevent-host-death family antitoxin [Hyphomicrobiales bacterium]MBV9752905.1 type II toxin-antitoxin system prevent-host-death family antitoxin [Hyphomicrobiales bacterium]
MRVSVTDAKAKLTHLLRRAEAGDDVIITRHGQSAVRLVPVTVQPSSHERRALLEFVRASGARKTKRWPTAARSQDFLYDNHGLPK